MKLQIIASIEPGRIFKVIDKATNIKEAEIRVSLARLKYGPTVTIEILNLSDEFIEWGEVLNLKEVDTEAKGADTQFRV